MRVRWSASARTALRRSSSVHAIIAPHWSAHGALATAAAAVAATWYVWGRTPGDRYGTWGYLTGAAVVAFGCLYMANI